MLALIAVGIALAAVADLTLLLSNIRADVQQSSGVGGRQARAEYWIPQLEEAIANEPGTDAAYSARIDLAGLYMTVDRAGSAVAVLDDVIASGRDSGTVLRAHLDGARAALLMHGEPTQFLDYTSRFAAKVDEYRAAGVVYPGLFDDKLSRIELVEARYLSDSAHWLLMANRGGGDVADRGIAALMLEYASERILDYTARVGVLDSEAAAELLYRRGTHLSEAAALYDNLGHAESAARLHNGAVEPLTLLVMSHGESSFGHEAATLLLRERYLGGVSLSIYAEFAESIARRLAPGHEILTFLRAEALNLSANPRTLVAANRIFELIAELEEEWFEEEYQLHVNYQWSRIGHARNALELGDLEKAEEILEGLDGIAIRGEYLAGELADVTRVARLYGARGLGPSFVEPEPEGTDPAPVPVLDGAQDEEPHVASAPVRFTEPIRTPEPRDPRPLPWGVIVLSGLMALIVIKRLS